MHKTKWTLVALLALALLGAPQAFAAGKGKGQGQGQGQGKGQTMGTQGQWGTNQPPGWDSQGQRKGWTKKDPESTMPGGLNKNLDTKYPKGLEKTR
jgi:hypothetical protein